MEYYVLQRNRSDFLADITYTGSSKSVVLQDEQSVSNATNLINMVLNGDDASAIKKQIKKYNK